MFPPPTREKTSLSRVLAAIVFAFVFPAVILAQVLAWTDSATTLPQRAATAMSAVIVALPAGAVMGWPYVLCAACAWACLHGIGRPYRSLAALVGTTIGVAVAIKLDRFDGVERVLLWPFSAILGLITGLGVWRIAYGRFRSITLPFRAKAKT